MNKKGFSLTELMMTITVILILLIAPLTWIFKSHMEAKAYNRLTGSNATTWEAMWVQLRVQGDSTKE